MKISALVKNYRFSDRPLVLSESLIVLIFTISLFIGFASVYFSYHTEITSSSAWMKWGQGKAWVGDSSRLLALYALAILLIKTSFRAGRQPRELRYTVQVDLLNSATVVIFIATVMVLNFYYYPIYFEKELLKTTGNRLSVLEIKLVEDDYFGQVYKPFFAYFFYAAGLWIGIILPTFLLLLNGFMDDIKKAKDSLRNLVKAKVCLKLKKGWKEEDSKNQLNQALSDLEMMNDECILKMRYLVQRYVPALLVVITGYALFNIVLSNAVIGPDIRFSESQTAQARSTFGWIIIIYLLIFLVFIKSFVGIFSKYRDTIKQSIHCIRKVVDKKSSFYEYRDIIRERTASWDIERTNTSNFIVNTLIFTGSFSLPIFLIFVSTFIWVAFEFHQELVPLSIIEFFRETFTEPNIP